MKLKITLLFALWLLGSNVSFAQTNQEDMSTLSIMTEAAKAKNYDSAYKPFMELRERNPKFNRAIYVYGERILADKIKNASGAEKVAYVNDLIKLWDERMTHFASKTPKGEYEAKACQLMYDNKDILNKSNLELYDCFDAAYTADKKTFNNPKSLYTYFSLMVDLFDSGEKQDKDLFNKYDDVAEKIEEEVKNYSVKLNKLVEKEDAGTALTSKEKRYKKSYSSFLSAYDLISGNIDAKLGKRANCENLIPLYKRDFELYKNDAVWLRRAVSRMFNKECTDDPLYIKLVKAYDETEPSADTKYFVAGVLLKEGKESEAITYFEQSYDLESDSFKKSKLAYRIGVILKNKGRYGQARGYFRNALKLNPSNGRPHLAIAAMYAASANNCGDTTFNKRAVYWLAAEEARKAGRVDPTLKKAAAQSANSYTARAPSKADIFSAANSGKTIKIGCWIGSSVTVPKI
ncbi:tetratricopeptide repeat protein [Oceanihabitans sp. IOP_32]|uniref:tetratricopeptide repeat protein n=1 Tax=Oceanihabitans sp. IOP_32 TaxID=2529032 RepID=UPI0012937DE4|nr:tetratricopeptide repeat protein [Oceanihabitans sp. IOP_32]QFZ53977.1 tetratricopeptide repeat protein [Oceanihabitans sp. IOP_32]